MKRTLSLFFLSIFCFSTLQSVIPYFEYIFNYEYISKVLCINKNKVELNCNGKCHLKKQLSSTVDDTKTNNENSRVPVIKFDKRLLFILIPVRSSLQLVIRQKTPLVFYLENLKSKIDFKPPIPPPKIYLVT